jgi:hypothetical protein
MILPDAGRRVQAAIQCWKSLMAVDAVCGELASAMNSLEFCREMHLLAASRSRN